ncbi:division/cell wall cluster transcriptional repressor MraZ [Mycoplasma sp. Ms02]|uniref:division/cell wall cluster transcriptional repressor MraZ n=1 Tax=Mycoplasma sp. Ms02 TaxID=353851 RepID=UPI001C8A94BC|nr:cell division/cell wall cluster transcriptional repressor MraZ [Mycoplasma sp. Ms02]QZE12507.1 cell division/cell wall cluster transcriptional repressor MraZ [Mycoplasma sp. Ms02]
MVGILERKIDDKNRVQFPASLKNEMGNHLFISLGFDGNAEIRSASDFSKYVAVMENQSSFNKQARVLKRAILGNTVEVMLDASGRMLFPKLLIEKLAIQKDIYFVGVGSIVELWSKERYDDFMSEISDEEISLIAQNFSLRGDNE